MSKTAFHSTLFVVAMSMSATAGAAASKSSTTASNGEVSVKLSAEAGLGYDSNAFRAPRVPYTNYALAAQPAVTPQAKSGIFVPYAVKAEAEKGVDRDTSLLGDASLAGKHYLTSGLSNADKYNAKVHGGAEFVLGRENKAKNSVYVGALLENHHSVYFDRANGTARTAFNRYTYTSTGAEAKYKHRTGEVGYGVHGMYAQNNFETPAVGSELDHVYTELGADVNFAVLDKSKLKVALTHWVEDYSKLHARDRSGVLSAANPLRVYTYNDADFTLSSRLDKDWRMFLDYSYTWRKDGYVNYNDYTQHRIGARILFEEGPLKARLAFHHWARNYQNAFAFDNPIAGAKIYSGNHIKFKAELAQTKTSALWAEVVRTSQNSSDLRYDYSRTQIMGGMSWQF